MDWLSQKASSFLNRSDLSYEEALELFKTTYINKEATIRIVFDPPSSCDLDNALVEGLNVTITNRIHRFVRLSKVLKWQFYELDRCIRTIGNGSAQIDENLLIEISWISDIKKRVRTSLKEMFSWWSPIDGQDYLPVQGKKELSLFKDIFLNQVNQDAGNREVFVEILEGANNNPPSLKESEDLLMASFGITADELSILAKNTSGELTLESLSQIYRRVSLSKAIKLSIIEFDLLIQLIPIDPFSNPENTYHFLDVIDKIRESGFKPLELIYTLRHGDGPSDSMALPDTQLKVFFGSLQQELLAIEESFPQVPVNSQVPELTISENELETLLNERLAIILEQEIGEEQLRIVKGNSTLSLPDQRSLFINSVGKYLPNSSILFDTLQLLNPLSQLTDRLLLVLQPLTNYLREDLKKNMVIQQFSSILGLSEELVTTLLNQVLTDANDLQKQAIHTFLEESFSSYDTTLEILDKSSPIYLTWTRIHKAGILLQHLNITPKELAWLNNHINDLELLNWNALPVNSAPLALNPFLSWERVYNLLQLRSISKAPEFDWYDLLNKALEFQPGAGLSAIEASEEFLTF